MHSQSHFRKSLNLRRNGDFWQRNGKVHSPTRRNGVICPPTKRSDVYVSQGAYSGSCAGSDPRRCHGLRAFDWHHLRRSPLSSSRGKIALRSSGPHKDPIEALGQAEAEAGSVIAAAITDRLYVCRRGGCHLTTVRIDYNANCDQAGAYRKSPVKQNQITFGEHPRPSRPPRRKRPSPSPDNDGPSRALTRTKVHIRLKRVD
jgi:hypothetical protein